MYELLQKILTYLRSMWRFRWYAMVLAWVVVIVGWYKVYTLPDVYEVSASVHVNTESVLRPLMQGLVIEPNLEQRLRLLTRTLKSRSNMEKLAQMSEDEANRNTADNVKISVDNLVSNIQLATSRGAENIYTISYSNRDPNLANIVVNNLLSIVKENTLKRTDAGVDNAELFLSKQLENYKRKLIEAESRLEEYKKSNAELMPALGQGYFVNLQTVRESLSNAQLELSEATKRRDELKRQMSGEEPVFGFSASTANLSSPHPLDTQIQELQNQLDELLLQYTELHPKVKTLSESIERLKAKRASDLARRPKTRIMQPALETNPIYQQLSVALSEAEAQVASLRVRVAEYKERENKLQKMVNTMPAFEAELNRLNREVETQQQNYSEMLERHETALISTEMEETGNTVQFRIIDPPRVPGDPTGPNRFMLNGVVLALGIGVGLGFVFVLSEIRPVVYDTQVLNSLTGLPVFGVVSRIMTDEIKKRERMEYGGYASAFMLLISAFAGTSLI